MHMNVHAHSNVDDSFGIPAKLSQAHVLKERKKTWRMIAKVPLILFFSPMEWDRIYIYMLTQ